ncbi:hypothetical protein AB7M35_000577 [Amorphus suaedae]
MWMPLRKTLAIVAVATGAFAFGVGGAAAQSCSALKSELARLSAGGSAAVKSQIASLERQAVANGCRGQNGWGRPRACAGIDARLSELKAQGGARASNPTRVRQLQRAIAANCGKPEPQRQATRPSRAQQAAAQPSANDGGYNPDRMTTHGSVIIHGTRPDNFLGSEVKQKTGFFSTLFGRGRVERLREDGTRVQQASTDPAEKVRSTATRATVSGGVEGVHGIYHGGGMKTWCVRLCDGFYFPISYSTSSSSYKRDLAICQGRCPGADVSLYSHPASLDPEDMVSTVSGERYTKLPTAFAYRTTVSGNCGCELKTPQVKSASAADAEADPSADDAVVADEPQQTEDVQVAAFATEGDTPSATAADKATDAASELAGLTAIGSLSDTGSASRGAPAATVARPPSSSEDASSDGAAVVDVVARPSADEPGVSEARPITEQDLNVRKVGPTYYADQIAVSAGAAQARQNAR